MEISTTSDVEAFARPCSFAFGIQPTPAPYIEWMKLMDAGRAHIAYADGKVVGAAGAFAHTLTIPGGTVAAAAVCNVGVLPSHRRRGILTKLQQVQLTDIHRRGESVAYLWASEGAIYGRFGYGLASQMMNATIPTKSGRLRGSLDRLGAVQIVEQKEAYEQIAPIYDRVRKEYPGMFLRDERWWRVKCLSKPELFHAVWDNSAYALYRVKMDYSTYSGEVEVIEALSDSLEGYRQIWRYLLDMDLMQTVSASYLPTDHPLVLMLADPSRADFQMRSGLWVRIVDVEAALGARAFAMGSIVIQIVDELFPHNEGAWRISADAVTRVSTSPDLIADISDLGSVYLAGFTFSDLARSGRVREQVPGSIDRADQLFSWNRKPWCPEGF